MSKGKEEDEFSITISIPTSIIVVQKECKESLKHELTDKCKRTYLHQKNNLIIPQSKYQNSIISNKENLKFDTNDKKYYDPNQLQKNYEKFIKKKSCKYHLDLKNINGKKFVHN